MSNKIKKFDESLIIFPTQSEKENVYSFLDPIVQKQCGSEHVKIRQITTTNDFKVLAEAREKMYSQRKRYYSALFDSESYLDDDDFRSYIFAFFYKDEIIGSQRVTPYPFEISKYINQSVIDKFLGRYHQFSTVEFSRLVVDKKSPVKGVADVLGRTAGTLITLLLGFTQYITYSRPYLKRKAFRFESEFVDFKIPERGNHDYSLFKGNLLEDICGYYELERSHMPKSFDDFLIKISNNYSDQSIFRESINE